MASKRKKILAVVAIGLIAAALGLNIVAYAQARAMTRFVRAGERTKPPERLTFLQKLRVLALGVNVPRPENSRTPSDEGLSFETVRFPGAFGIELEAWHVPRMESRGMVVIFHGYATAKSSMLKVARGYHELGYATLIVDFHGSGGSKGDSTSIGFHEAEDVRAAAAQAKKLAPGKRIILHGASMGAVAILRAVGELGVAADAIILECPFDRMLQTVRNRFRTMGVPSWPAAWALVYWGGKQQGFDGFSHNPMDYARKVSCPSLVLHGEDDPRVSLAEARAVFEKLAGCKEFHAFRGVGHESYLAAKPDEWRAAVNALLAALDKK